MEKINLSTYKIKIIEMLTVRMKQYEIDNSITVRNISMSIKKFLTHNFIEFESLLKINKIKIRVIRTNEKNQVKESVPFSPISLYELLFENWESDDKTEQSKLRTSLDYTYIFVVIKETNKSLGLENLVVWEPSKKEIDNIKNEYETAKSIISTGIILTEKTNKSGIRIENNLLKSKQTNFIHMSPHAINKDDIDIKYLKYTEGCIRITRQSFWLNKNFINNIISSKWKINLKEE